MRTLIVHNVDAGFGSDAIYLFMRALSHNGDECILRSIGKGFHPAKVLADAESFDCVVVSGGDGTVATLLYELRYRNVPTCVFPSGTANLLFANLGNANEPNALARACRRAKTVQCDLAEMTWTDQGGRRHTRGFSIMSGTGFDAEIMRAAIPNKQTMGEAAYFFAVLSNITPDVVDFTIEVDGQTYERTGIACLVANNAMMQGDIEIVPNTRMDDGTLDVIVLETSDATQLIRPLIAGILDPVGQTVDRPHIEHFEGSKILVKTSKPMGLEIDGDPMEGEVQGYEVEVLPGASTLIIDNLSRYA